MPTLQAIYIGLLVFGAGVMVVDFFGVFSQGGHDGAHHGSGHHGGGRHGGADHAGHHQEARRDAEKAPEALAPAPAEAGVGLVSRIASALRLLVYFALGSGAMGLIAILKGLGPLQGLGWSVGAGVAAALISRLVRGLARKELDSTFKSEELLMEEAEIVVPVEPGMMGQAELRKFGANLDIYVKASDPKLALPKGTRVRIVDGSEELYTVEPLFGLIEK